MSLRPLAKALDDLAKVDALDATVNFNFSYISAVANAAKMWAKAKPEFNAVIEDAEAWRALRAKEAAEQRQRDMGWSYHEDQVAAGLAALEKRP